MGWILVPYVCLGGEIRFSTHKVLVYQDKLVVLDY